ncbi:MAG: hypothetical protein AB7G75_12585 [Candidatus Binatia bacterium]
MKDTKHFPSHGQNLEDPAEKIVEHLLHTPSDLIDARHLMRRFRASVDDVLRALHRLENLEPEVNGCATY